MSNLPQQDTVNQYLADGATLIFIYSYLILLDTDLLVYLTPPNTTPDPAADLQVLNVDYTVQGVGTESGGTITFTNLPASNAIVTIVRNIQASIDTEYNQARNINGQNLDDDFGRITLVSQQISTNFGTFGLQYTPSSVGFTGSNGINPTGNVVPRLLDNQIWVGQNGGVIAATLEQNPDVSVLRSQLASEANGSDGTTIIGYYDSFHSTPGTLNAFLNALYPTVNTNTAAAIATAMQKSSPTYAQVTGTANAIVATPSPAYAYPYTEGTVFSFKAALTNTGAVTIALNGNTAVPIKYQASNLQAFYIRQNFIYTLVYNLTENAFEIINPSIPNIVALMSMTNSQNLPADSADHKINFNSIIFDPFGIANGTNNTMTAPIAAYYDLEACYNSIANGNTTGSLFLSVYINNIFQFRLSQMTFGTDNQSVLGSRPLFLNIGDVLDLRAANTGTVSTTIGFASGDRTNCWFALTYVAT